MDKLGFKREFAMRFSTEKQMLQTWTRESCCLNILIIMYYGIESIVIVKTQS